MMFTSPMRLLAAVALIADSEAIAKELLKLGALELVSIRELSGDWKSRVAQIPPGVDTARIGELRKRVEGFMSMAVPPVSRPVLDGGPGLSVTPTLSADGQARSAELDAAVKLLDGIAADINGLRDQQKSLQDEILKLEEIYRQVGSFEDLKAGAAASSTYSFLSIRAGLLPAESLDRLTVALEGLPTVIMPSEGSGAMIGIVLISLKKDAGRISPILERLAWEDARLPETSGSDKDGAMRELSAKIDGLRKKQADCSLSLNEYFDGKRKLLSDLWSSLRIQELVARVKASFSGTEHAVLFSGWIPEDRVKAVEAGIRKTATGGCSLEWLLPGQDEAGTLQAPVAMRNPRVLKPFEGLVRNYGVPEYGSVDPTPFVALAYLSMFGLMFGDAGHGLVVALIGLLGLRSARKSGRPDGLFRVILYCGGAAIIAGMLFGSYFGMELFPALWFDYHGVVNGLGGEGNIRTIYDILGITIRFGIIVLGTGFIINWINLIRRRQWLTLLMDKGGLLGGWIYGAGTWVAFYFVMHNYKGLPPGSLLLPLLGIPTLILAFKAPIAFILGHGHGASYEKSGAEPQASPGRGKFKAGMIMNFFMEWIVEVLEIYSGYLANTLSFMRVAGLGIAHVSLMTAFFQIARMITPTGPLSPAAIAILVLGNTLVIALEGLSAGIQSLRLNYYEFFSRYFNGTGKAYRPISFSSTD